jgi:4-hydroxythreonine-4-phosphate dehydrogenase
MQSSSQNSGKPFQSMSSKNNCPVAISLGDPAGIGPEISLKAACTLSKQSFRRPLLLIGDKPLLEQASRHCSERVNIETWKGYSESGGIYFLETGSLRKKATPGQHSKEYGLASFSYFLQAWELLQEKKVSALVTAPISKTAWHKAGIYFPGHTEAIKVFTGEKTEMLMATKKLRVLLATTHIPLQHLWKHLTSRRLVEAALSATAFCTQYYSPPVRIGVCGLNPHAGESNTMGSEETDIILPAIETLQKKGINAEGPFPSDTLFHSALSNPRFTFILALYHDQGMIPLKTFFSRSLVNISTSLQWIRTSPGHGTAFDIAHKGLADPSSMIEAIRTASRFSRIKEKHDSV